ncbi:MAG: hypothetical protein D6732_20405, partial [Methanobacteriota archaeon]
NLHDRNLLSQLFSIHNEFFMSDVRVIHKLMNKHGNIDKYEMNEEICANMLARYNFGDSHGFMNSLFVDSSDIIYDIFLLKKKLYHKIFLYDECKIEYLRRYYVLMKFYLCYNFFIGKKDEVKRYTEHMINNFPLGYKDEWKREKEMIIPILVLGEIVDSQLMRRTLKKKLTAAMKNRQCLAWLQQIDEYLNSSPAIRKDRFRDLNARFTEEKKDIEGIIMPKRGNRSDKQD